MRSVFRSFRRHYHKVRKAVLDLEDPIPFSFSAVYDGDELSASHTTPDQEWTVRFVVLMRPFLNPHSSIYYLHIWDILRNQFSEELPDDAVAAIDQAIEQMCVGFFKITYNHQQLTAENIYHILSEGHYFNNDAAIAEYLRGITSIPLAGPLLWQQFYTYTWSGINLVSTLFSLVQHVERSGTYRALYPLATGEQHCIYCLTTTGEFTSEEHVIPEALGNDELVLPIGVVCNACNHTLATLDSYLVAFEPIAFLQVQFVPYTKSGKLPHAHFQNVIFSRRGPNHFHIQPQDRSGEIKNTRDLGDGWFAWDLKMRGRKPDFVKLGRALYKIGLGMVALGDGPEQACHPRYDQAREFIRHSQAAPNDLLIQTRFQPQKRVHVGYQQLSTGTTAMINIYGLVFLLNLETTPSIELRDELVHLNFELFKLATKDTL